MPPQNPNLEITPYTSTVPLVQIPPSQIEADTRPAAPIPGQFGRKGTGALAIGDSILKGFMEGHQKKVQEKYAQAQATISAADAATQAAYQKYQDALSQAGGKVDDPTAKAAYDAYQGVFNQAKATKAKFILPEDGKKGQKKDGKKGVKGEVEKGFGGIKDFFAANPHIVPEIALMTMQPKPAGMSPETQTQVLDSRERAAREAESEEKLKGEQQKRADVNLVAAYGRLTPEEIAKLPADVQKQINDPENGVKAAQYRIALEQPARAKYDWFVDQAGEFHSLPQGTQDVPPGWKIYNKPTAGMIPKVGTEQFMVSNYLAQHKIDPEKAPPELLKYLHAYWQWKQAQTTSTGSTSSVDIHGNRTTGTTATRTEKPPSPSDFGLPADFKPPTEDGPAASTSAVAAAPEASAKPASATKGGITAAPKQAKTAAKGGITPPPGKQTLTDVQRAEKTTKEQREMYAKSQSAYDAKIKDAQTKFSSGKIDEATFTRMKNQAALDRADSNREAWKWYIQQVHQVGGKMPWEQPNAPKLHKDKNGVIYGFDGKNWVNVDTGEPYQEQ